MRTELPRGLPAGLVLVDHADFQGGAESVARRALAQMPSTVMTDWAGPLYGKGAWSVPMPSPLSPSPRVICAGKQLRRLYEQHPDRLWIANTSRAALYLVSTGIATRAQSIWLVHDMLLDRPVARFLARFFSEVWAAGPAAAEWYDCANRVFWPEGIIGPEHSKPRSVQFNVSIGQREPTVLGFPAGRLASNKGASVAVEVAAFIAQRGRPTILKVFAPKERMFADWAGRTAYGKPLRVDFTYTPDVSPLLDDGVSLWLSPGIIPEAGPLVLHEALIRNAPMATISGDGVRVPRSGAHWLMPHGEVAGLIASDVDCFKRTVTRAILQPSRWRAAVEAFALDSEVFRSSTSRLRSLTDLLCGRLDI